MPHPGLVFYNTFHFFHITHAILYLKNPIKQTEVCH